MAFTDCCQSGTVCDLDKDVWGSREVIHFAAVRETSQRSASAAERMIP